MRNCTTQNSKLPFKCRMLCVSLVGGSLLLVLVFLAYYMGYISIETAGWTAAGIFTAAALYEIFLLTLITRYMLNGDNKNSVES